MPRLPQERIYAGSCLKVEKATMIGKRLGMQLKDAIIEYPVQGHLCGAS